jgi:hypothetical protein
MMTVRYSFLYRDFRRKKDGAYAQETGVIYGFRARMPPFGFYCCLKTGQTAERRWTFFLFEGLKGERERERIGFFEGGENRVKRY